MALRRARGRGAGISRGDGATRDGDSTFGGTIAELLQRRRCKGSGPTAPVTRPAPGRVPKAGIGAAMRKATGAGQATTARKQEHRLAEELDRAIRAARDEMQRSSSSSCPA